MASTEVVDLVGVAALGPAVHQHRRLVHAGDELVAARIGRRQPPVGARPAPVAAVGLQLVRGAAQPTGPAQARSGGQASGITAGKLSPTDLTERDGLPVTTPARACWKPPVRATFEAAVVIVDAALRITASAAKKSLQAAGAADLAGESYGAVIDPVRRRPVGVCRRVATAGADVQPRLAEAGAAGRLLRRGDRLHRPGRLRLPGIRRLSSSTALSKYAAGSPDVSRPGKRPVRTGCVLGVCRSFGRTWSDLDHPSRTITQSRAAFARSRRYRPDAHPPRRPRRLLTIEGWTPEVVGSQPNYAGATHSFRG